MEEENLEFEIVSRDEIIVAVSDKTVAVSTVLYQHGVERLDSWNHPGMPLSPPTSTLTRLSNAAPWCVSKILISGTLL